MTCDEHKQTLRLTIEHAPAEPGPIADGLLGWLTTAGVYVCAFCAGRIFARGCNLPDSSRPIWSDQTTQPGECCCCEST